MRRLSVALLGLLPALLAPSIPAGAQDAVRTETVHFAPGKSGTSIAGHVTGYETVLYVLGAEAGQTMHVRLTSSNISVYFNVYEPGKKPGDQALANGSMTPEINVFQGALPLSGLYGISVYLYRNAARGGESASYKLDVSIEGQPAKTLQRDFADGMQGGPDFFAVKVSEGGELNLRAEPSTGSAIVEKVPNGTVLRNRGCRAAEGRIWCKVATLPGQRTIGWAANDYLVEGAAPASGALPRDTRSYDALVPGTPYHATGEIACSRGDTGAKQSCTFGVVRAGNGAGAVTITWPDGKTRVIRYRDGRPVSYDRGAGQPDLEMTARRQGSDDFVVHVGEERYEISDIVIMGG